DPLLHREPAGEQPHQPGQLGQAQDVLMRDVADICLAEKRQAVVLAQREERDRPLHHLADPAVRPAATLGRERGHQLLVTLIPAGRIEDRPEEAARRVGRGRRPGGHAHRGEDLRHVPLEPGPLLWGYLPWGDRSPALLAGPKAVTSQPGQDLRLTRVRCWSTHGLLLLATTRRPAAASGLPALTDVPLRRLLTHQVRHKEAADVLVPHARPAADRPRRTVPAA